MAQTTNTTQRLGLNQWNSPDDLNTTQFSEDNRIIDRAVIEVEGDVAGIDKKIDEINTKLSQSIDKLNADFSNTKKLLETNTWSTNFRGLSILARRDRGTIILRVEGSATQAFTLPGTITTLPEEFRRPWSTDIYTFYQSNASIRFTINVNGTVTMSEQRRLDTGATIPEISVGATPRITIAY